MKKKLRAITLNGQKFAWWFAADQHETVLKLSPFEDKTTVASIVFSDRDIAVSWVVTGNPFWDQMRHYNESVVVLTEGTVCDFRLIGPKMAGLLLAYFIEKNLFKTRTNSAFNGYELLSQMGYQVVAVKKGICW